MRQVHVSCLVRPFSHTCPISSSIALITYVENIFRWIKFIISQNKYLAPGLGGTSIDLDFHVLNKIYSGDHLFM